MKKQKLIIQKEFSSKEKKVFLNQIEQTLSILLGPEGRSVLYMDKFSQLKYLNNASEILESLNFNSKEERLLLKIFQHVSKKTQSVCGDGSSSVTLFLIFSLSYCLKLITSGHNSIILSKGLKKICTYCLSSLVKYSKAIKKESEIKALIKSLVGKKLDSKFVDFLQNSLKGIKRDGLVLIEESFSSKNEMYCLEGIEIDKGFASSYFVNNLKTFEVSYDKALLLITGNITNLDQIKDCLEHSKKINQPLVIIAENISKELLSTLVLNTIKGKLKVVLIKYSSIRFLKTGLLQDLALLSHAIYKTSEGYGVSESSKEINNNIYYKIEDLGFLDKVIVKKEKSTFFISKFSKLLVNRRINELNRELLSCETDYEKNLYKTRISRLSGNILKLKLVQSNEYEKTFQTKLIEKMILALTSALEEGSIAGGGCFYLFLIPELKQWSQLNLIGDELYSSQVILNSLSKLFEKLSSQNLSYDIREKLQNLGYPYTYDSVSKKIDKAINLSLLDSSKTIRFIFSNSISMLSTLIVSQ